MEHPALTVPLQHPAHKPERLWHRVIPLWGYMPLGFFSVHQQMVLRWLTATST